MITFIIWNIEHILGFLKDTGVVPRDESNIWVIGREILLQPDIQVLWYPFNAVIGTK